MGRVLVVAFLILGALLMTAPAVFAQECLDRLGSNSYTCTHKSSFNPNETSSTLEFFGNGNGSWSGYSFVTSVACSCGTTGIFKTPKFGQSPSKWQCIGVHPDFLNYHGLVIEGSVGASGKITQVEAHAIEFDAGPLFKYAYVLKCEKDE